jgi:hypothetical protein
MDIALSVKKRIESPHQASLSLASNIAEFAMPWHLGN